LLEDQKFFYQVPSPLPGALIMMMMMIMMTITTTIRPS